MVFPRSIKLTDPDGSSTYQHSTACLSAPTPFSFLEIKLRCSYMEHLLQRLSEGRHTHLCPSLPTKHVEIQVYSQAEIQTQTRWRVLARTGKEPTTSALSAPSQWPSAKVASRLNMLPQDYVCIIIIIIIVITQQSFK